MIDALNKINKFLKVGIYYPVYAKLNLSIFVLGLVAYIFNLISIGAFALIFVSCHSIFISILLYMCIVKLDLLNVEFSNKIEIQSESISRVYNSSAVVVGDKSVISIEQGYHIIITHNHENKKTYVEHVRSLDNSSLYSFDEAILSEHHVNYKFVWGELYEGPKPPRDIVVNG